MIVPLGKSLVADELPILERHGLSMWEYVVLNALDERPTRTQSALADAIGADKTRIIPVLDELQRRRLIKRRPDESDRRVRLLSLTADGLRVRTATQAEIQRGEEERLRALTPTQRRGFLAGLQILSAAAGDADR